MGVRDAFADADDLAVVRARSGLGLAGHLFSSSKPQ
jgi:hypothetical protein